MNNEKAALTRSGRMLLKAGVKMHEVEELNRKALPAPATAVRPVSLMLGHEQGYETDSSYTGSEKNILNNAWKGCPLLQGKSPVSQRSRQLVEYSPSTCSTVMSARLSCSTISSRAHCILSEIREGRNGSSPTIPLPSLFTGSPKDKENEHPKKTEQTPACRPSRAAPVKLRVGLSKQSIKTNESKQDKNSPPAQISNKETRYPEPLSCERIRVLPERKASSVARNLMMQYSSESGSEPHTQEFDIDNPTLPIQDDSPPKKLSKYQLVRLKNLAENKKLLQEVNKSALLSTGSGKIKAAKQAQESHSASTSSSKTGEIQKHAKLSTASTTTSGAKNARQAPESISDSPPEHDPISDISDSEPDPEHANAAPLPAGHNFNPEYDASDVDDIPNSPIMKTKQVKEERKMKRNLGEEYVTRKGKIMRARKWNPPHNCARHNCQEIITEDIAESIFVEFWEMGSHDRRVQYVGARIESTPVARSRKRDPESGIQKSATYSYFLEIGGTRVRVCKDTFLKTLDISSTFVKVVLHKKRQQVSGVTFLDKRGRKSPIHKLSAEKSTLVKRHIESFPCYVSHYCRKDTSQRYLPSSLDIRKMYKLFLEANPENHVSYSTYFRTFKTFKLKFHQRLSDTCSKCDALVLKIKHAVGEEKVKLEDEHQLHLRRAEKAYELKNEMKTEAQNDNSKTVLIFDLEQCLPSPNLNCGTVYYKRQLYTYNLTIYDTSSKLLYCYMWHEGEGMRGANEVASCLFEHVKTAIPAGVREIVLFSDCCSGQNRNSIICAMFQVALQVHPTLERVDHIFLVPGHTRMECDAKHSVIERAIKKTEVINVPADYYRLVEEAGMVDLNNFPEGKYKVIKMASKLYNFAALMKPGNPLIKRSVTSDKQPFKYMKSHWFHYEKTMCGRIMVKSAFSPEAPFEILDFRRSRKNNLPSLCPLLKLANVGPMAITTKKKEDLMSLLQFIDPCHHSFYQTLPATDGAQNNQDVHPDIPAELHLDDDF